jgi:putative flippase GtrA
VRRFATRLCRFWRRKDASMTPARITRPAARVDSNNCDLPLAIQLARYLVVGGVAFLADFAALAILTELLHVHYLLSAAIAFGLGMAVNYALSVRYVFKVRTVTNVRVEFLLFTVIGLVGLAMNELVLWIVTHSLHLYYLHSKLIATALVLGWNFSARKILLFSSPTPALPGETARS